MSDTPTDPKAHAGSLKTPLQLLPPAGLEQTALALGHGAKKYGAWNWRESEVRLSTYVGAIKRHLDAYWSGEETDPESGLPHIAHVAASAMLLMDARRAGSLVEDHPPLPGKPWHGGPPGSSVPSAGGIGSQTMSMETSAPSATDSLVPPAGPSSEALWRALSPAIAFPL